MKTGKIKTQPREITGNKVKHLREEGLLPAVIYGNKLESTNISLDRKSFRKVFKQAGYSSLVDAEIGKDTVKVLVKEVQMHPVYREITHVSLYAVDMSSEIETDVPLKLVGVSPAVKNSIGIMSMPTDTLTLRCLPADLPHEIEIDISGLAEIGDSIRVSDITLPKGVELSNQQSEEARIVAIVPPQKEIVEEEPESLLAEGEEGEEGAEGEAGAADTEGGAAPADSDESK